MNKKPYVDFWTALDVDNLLYTQRDEKDKWWLFYNNGTKIHYTQNYISRNSWDCEYLELLGCYYRADDLPEWVVREDPFLKGIDGEIVTKIIR